MLKNTDLHHQFQVLLLLDLVSSQDNEERSIHLALLTTLENHHNSLILPHLPPHAPSCIPLSTLTLNNPLASVLQVWRGIAPNHNLIFVLLGQYSHHRVEKKVTAPSSFSFSWPANNQHPNLPSLPLLPG